MLQCAPNSSTGRFSLDYISPDGKTGCLIPAVDIRQRHQPIAVSQYDDGVIRVGAVQIDTKKIVSHKEPCLVTATAFGDDIVGVSIILNGIHGVVPMSFEYTSSRKPLCLVESGCPPFHELKPFSQLSLVQKIAHLLSFGVAYPRVTV